MKRKYVGFETQSCGGVGYLKTTTLTTQTQTPMNFTQDIISTLKYSTCTLIKNKENWYKLFHIFQRGLKIISCNLNTLFAN
jgi:hypothetical protein